MIYAAVFYQVIGWLFGLAQLFRKLNANGALSGRTPDTPPTVPAQPNLAANRAQVYREGDATPCLGWGLEAALSPGAAAAPAAGPAPRLPPAPQPRAAGCARQVSLSELLLSKCPFDNLFHPFSFYFFFKPCVLPWDEPQTLAFAVLLCERSPQIQFN